MSRYTTHALAVFGAAADQLVSSVAFQIEGQAKINVRDNGQIDTGFMVNSIYTVAPKRNTYDATWSSGEYRSKAGEVEGRERADEIRVHGQHRAIVAVGAYYGLYQEARNSYLYRALEMVRDSGIDMTVSRGRR